MSSESELESDEEFDRTFGEQHCEILEYDWPSGDFIPTGFVGQPLQKAIFKGRVDRVSRLLAVPPTTIRRYTTQDDQWRRPILEAAVGGNEEIFNMVWEKYALNKSSWNDFHFVVTMASLFKLDLLRKALERRFPRLGTSWDWNEPIMRAVEVISRPTQLAPHYSDIKSNSCFQELLPCCWQGKTPQKLKSKAVEVDRGSFCRQSWRQQTLQRFTSAVLDGDVTSIRNIMKKASANLFFRGDRLADYFCEHQFGCLQVLSSPFCIAIARNQREVFFELLSVIDRLPLASQNKWIEYHSRTVFNIALVHADPTIVRTLLRYFFVKKGLCWKWCDRPTIGPVNLALDVASSREDLSLLTNIEQCLTYDWESLLLDTLNYSILRNLQMRNRGVLQLLFQMYPSDVVPTVILQRVFKFRFHSALRSILLQQLLKIPLRFLSKHQLTKWPEGVAMLFEDSLLVTKDDKVRSLQHSCRIAIRGFLRRPIRDSVKQLPLPRRVRKMLIFHSLPVYRVDDDLTPFSVNSRSECISSELCWTTPPPPPGDCR